MGVELKKIAHRVLVADDLASAVMLASEVLRGRGYRVSEATSGEAVYALLDSGTFDAILLNLHMPPMRGIQYVREVKRRAGDAKIIVTTVEASVERRRIIEAGADAFLITPIDFKEVLAHLR